MNIQQLVEAKMKYYKYFTEKESLEAVKQDGYALQYVKDQTETICLEAVKQDRDALKYVKEEKLIVVKEMTVSEISKLLGFEVKIVK